MNKTRWTNTLSASPRQPSAAMPSECDVHISSDRCSVIMHDGELSA